MTRLNRAVPLARRSLQLRLTCSLPAPYRAGGRGHGPLPGGDGGSDALQQTCMTVNKVVDQSEGVKMSNHASSQQDFAHVLITGGILIDQSERQALDRLAGRIFKSFVNAGS